jgi:hypothetical protein
VTTSNSGLARLQGYWADGSWPITVATSHAGYKETSKNIGSHQSCTELDPSRSNMTRKGSCKANYDALQSCNQRSRVWMVVVASFCPKASCVDLARSQGVGAVTACPTLNGLLGPGDRMQHGLVKSCFPRVIWLS